MCPVEVLLEEKPFLSNIFLDEKDQRPAVPCYKSREAE